MRSHESSKRQLSPAARRLLPLYISSFLQSLPLWYAIEKLFMTRIGFDTALIGVMVAVMTAVTLAVETPSGIWADRWSRRGVMLLGCAALLVSGLVGGLSYNVPVYIVSAVSWGIYAALYSGTYDSVIYDVALEEQGTAANYEYYLGRLRAVEGAGFVVGALGGGLIANYIGMRPTYFISLPFILAGGWFLLRLREPTLHRAETAVPVWQHVRRTFAAVLRRRSLMPVVVATVGFAVLEEAVFELGQLWFIAAATPVILYGLFSAIVFGTWAVGGFLAPRLHSRAGLTAVFGVVVIAIFGLIFTRSYWLLVSAEFLLGVSTVALSIVLSGKLHDELPSSLRAGSASVMSTLGGLVVIPGSIVFTYVAGHQTIFTASYLLLGVAVVAAISAYVLIPQKSPQPADVA